MLAFVEYTHALVVDYAERYEDASDPVSVADVFGGEDATSALRREVLDENKWRAMRRGHDASFVLRDAASEVSLAEVVDRECERLDISGIRDVYESESGAAAQRRRLDEDGERALYESLVL